MEKLKPCPFCGAEVKLEKIPLRKSIYGINKVRVIYDAIYRD